jgi:hypothetical protein
VEIVEAIKAHGFYRRDAEGAELYRHCETEVTEIWFLVAIGFVGRDVEPVGIGSF